MKTAWDGGCALFARGRRDLVQRIRPRNEVGAAADGRAPRVQAWLHCLVEAYVVVVEDVARGSHVVEVLWGLSNKELVGGTPTSLEKGELRACVCVRACVCGVSVCVWCVRVCVCWGGTCTSAVARLSVR